MSSGRPTLRCGITLRKADGGFDFRHESPNLDFRLRPHPTTAPKLADEMAIAKCTIAKRGRTDLMLPEESFNVFE